MVKKRWRIDIFRFAGIPAASPRGRTQIAGTAPFVKFRDPGDKGPAMDSDRLARLTGQQRACLRLVFAHMTSKEIAPQLGIEPGSVDQHIKTAMRILGVGDRRTAARLLAEYEGLQPAQPLAYQSLDIAPRADPAAPAPMNEGERRPHGPSDAGKWGSRADPVPAPDAGFRRPLPLPIWGGKPSDLGPMQRLGWILFIMVMVALTFGVFLAGLDALSRLGRGIS
jgi:DNA-binding CsgD family transcriptional regulator